VATAYPISATPFSRPHYMSTRKPKKRQLALLLSQDEMALLLAVQDALRPTFGDLSYAAVIRYGLRLAAAHLGIEVPSPVPLPTIPPPVPPKR
jgi:hypothetical protein